jgi:DNA polymerase-3 subunit delta
MVGTDLKALAGEVEKAALYVGDRKNISLEDVEVLAGDLKAQNVFQLGEAVGRRDSGEAIRILNKLTTVRGKELFILNMLARHFRRLAMAMELLDAGLDRAEVGKQMGINPYFREKFFQQLKSYSGKELQNVFLHILNCDRTIKSSKLSPRLALEMMLLRICALN